MFIEAMMQSVYIAETGDFVVGSPIAGTISCFATPDTPYPFFPGLLYQ